MAQSDEVFKYLKETKAKPVSDSESLPVNEQLWYKYQQGDNSVATELLSELAPTINSAISTHAGGNAEYRTKAKVLALNAVKTYDPSQNSKLGTHVFNSLKRLNRISADRGNIIHVPEQSALDRKQLERVVNNYIIENGEEPSQQTLADLTGLSIKKIERLQNIKGMTSSSAVTSEQGDLLATAPRTALNLYEDTLYQELDETNKKIYEWLTGYNGKPMLSRQEVAQKLKITLPALSQRISKIDQFFATNGRRIEEVVYGRNIR